MSYPKEGVCDVSRTLVRGRSHGMAERDDFEMYSAEIDVVTGAFSYTGKYIARRLLADGKTVRTITGHPNRENPFGGRVQALPLDFDRPGELAESLKGATTLYNTYWVRFPRRDVTYQRAVENTGTLVKAAVEAGVRRIVHVSITNASEGSPFTYFSGKGRVERIIAGSGLSYAILRPTVIFGAEDILINNIAWFLRKFPIFPIAGSGAYRLQPVYVEDVADLAVQAGQGTADTVADAVGPETFTFHDLVRLIGEAVGGRSRIVHVRPGVLRLLAGLMDHIVRDVVLTRDEMEGLMAGLLVSDDPPTGQTRLSHWLEQNRDGLGKRYSSELQRHY